MILTDSSDFALGNTSAGTLRSKLNLLSARSEVAGVAGVGTDLFLDLALDTRVQALKLQATNNPGCPYAQNLVAQGGTALSTRIAQNPLRYVVIVGGDDVIPFFRYPDQSLLGQDPATSHRSAATRPRRPASATTSSSARTRTGPRPWCPCARAISRSRDSPSAG